MSVFAIACLTGYLSGCVSSSLDDIGLESNSVSTSNTQIGSQIGPQISTKSGVSVPTTLTAAVAPSATALREDTLSPLPASTAITDFEAGSAPNRDAGIAEIRAKANATGANAPNINEIPTARGQHFTVDELRLKKALLRAEAQAAQGLITENELTQKRAQIAAMRRKAGSHYTQAVRQIAK